MAKNEPLKKRIHPATALAAIVAAGLVVRLIFLVQLGRSEFGGVLSLDSRFYYELASALSAGGAPPAGALDFNPLYPAFLVVVFKLFGAGMTAPRVAQFALGLFTIALAYAAGARLVEGPRKGKPSGTVTAIAAAAMTLFYRQFVLYEGTIIATALEVFLVAASFMLALALDEDLRGERPIRLRTRRIPRWVSSLLLGALLGAGALGRPNFFLLLVAGVPIWIFLRNLRKRRGLIPALSCLAGAALFLAPPIVYSAALSGRIVPVSAHGGINFYIGNRAGSPGVFQPPADMRADMRGMLEDAKMKAEAETGRAMTQPDVSGYYLRKASARSGATRRVGSASSEESSSSFSTGSRCPTCRTSYSTRSPAPFSRSCSFPSPSSRRSASAGSSCSSGAAGTGASSRSSSGARFSRCSSSTSIRATAFPPLRS